MTTLLTLFRHGQSIWNAIGRTQGQAPIPLSELGHRQAAYLGPLAAGLQPAVEALYCSDLLRCRQTMAPIAAALALPVHYDSRLREIDVGILQGLSSEEAQAYVGDALAAHRSDPMGVPLPGGETRAELRARSVEAIVQIGAAHLGQHVLVVTHGGSISEVLRHFGLWPYSPWAADAPPLGNTFRTVLRLADGGESAELLLPPDVSHLPPELISH